MDVLTIDFKGNEEGEISLLEYLIPLEMEQIWS